MKIISRNVAGINSASKCHQVINQCKKYDISFLQETKANHLSIAFIRAKWGSDTVYYSTTGAASRGVITLIHPRAAPIVLSEQADEEGQFHILLVAIKDRNWLLVNTYGSPEGDIPSQQTMIRLTNKLEGIQRQHTINSMLVGGDFNMVLEARDTTAGIRKPRAEGQLITLLNTFNLYDIAGLQSRLPKHTYFRHRHEQTSARHDRFYISQNLIQDTVFKILPRVSDHAPIELAIQEHRKATRWKFSDALLTDPRFIQKLHDTIQEVLGRYVNTEINNLTQMQNHIDFQTYSSTEIFCEVIEKVRNMCMVTTKEQRQTRKQAEETAMNDFIAARQQLNDNPDDQSAQQEYERQTEKLRLAQTRRHQQATERNHTNYATLGERTSRYHFAKANRGKASREIPKLIISENQGQRVLEGAEIQFHMFNKYAKIIQEDPEACQTTIEQFLGRDLTDLIRTCPPEHHLHLNSPVMKAEIINIVKDLKFESAPGPLGISNSLMKEMMPFIIEILIDVGNNLLFGENPTLPPWLFHRTVIFILKPGKPSTDPDAYRGLSMLEGFFKIFSKILSNRIQRSLAYIQQPQQFGFTKGKGILEASRTVLDVIQHAKRENQPLLLISTDFYKAFDTVSIQHIKNCLEFYQFPAAFTQAFMRLAKGTVQFEINGQLSEDYQINKGTGQGDPKSSYGYNLSSAPLNHYLANAPEVPRYKIQDQDVAPVTFADDACLLLNGDETELIIQLLQKIADFYSVAGLKLNLRKCEIMAINCDPNRIQALLEATNMKQVEVLKHLGIHIDSEGNLPHDTNIAPLKRNMDKIAESFNSALSTPIGRALYGKFLLSSKYIHRIQNFHFQPNELEALRKSALKLTWTRARMKEDNNSVRTHIARDRLAQPLYYGGMSVPDPIIQAKSLSFSWARKLCNPNRSLTWVWQLENLLNTTQRPNIQQHIILGTQEWNQTATAIRPLSPYWAETFKSIGHIISLANKYDKTWHTIPILGSEYTPEENNIAALHYRNPMARNLFQAGLQVTGQLFHLNNQGQINPNRLKTSEELEAEFNVNIPIVIQNSLSAMITSIRQDHRTTMLTTPQTFEKISTLQSLVRSRRTGCSHATRLLLQEQRSAWPWGDTPRSFYTYNNDRLININAKQFSRALSKIRANTLPPPVQWTSIQIFMRTLWTNVKEASTPRNNLRNNPISPNCSNCGQFPERTTHLIYDCQLAQQTWTAISTEFNTALRDENPDSTDIVHSRDMIMFNQIPSHLDDQYKNDLLHVIMASKHRLYQHKFRENLNRYPSTRVTILSLALDLERIIMVRRYNGINACFLESFNARLKTLVGL